MALVQLTVPGEQPAAPQRRKVAGIDLGTTNSLVAFVDESGAIEMVADSDGRTVIPSVVRYGPDGPVVGSEAVEAQIEHPGEVVSSIKRLMGRDRSDVEDSYRFDYAAGEGMVKIEIGGRTLSPVEVSADILRHLAALASARLDGPVEAAVVTVPAYFDDSQRQATKDAAALAGIKVLRLLNEPTAAALAYGLDKGEEGYYVVYDLGGGTFDVSVLEFSRELFKVLATGGDSALGGDDYDERLARYALAKAGAPEPPAAYWRRLLRKVRKAKELLSDEERAEVELVDGRRVEVDRESFHACTAELTGRTIEILRKCLADAGDPAVRGVIMVGGATGMPQVRAAVDAALAVPMFLDLDPEEVVARGAAAQAEILAGNRPAADWLLLDVTPLSFGIETMGGLVERIIPRNSALPIARAQEFTTHKDGQTAMSIHVVQGERDLAADCRSLARFSVKGIPPLAAGAARVRVTYQADADGILSVTAREMTTGTESGIEVKPSYGLTEDEVAAMLQAATAHAREDVEARRLAEARNEADALLAMLRGSLARDGELAGDDRPLLDAAMEKLEAAMAGEDVEAIRAAVQALDRASAGYAERRMQKAMRDALAGASVDDLA